MKHTKYVCKKDHGESHCMFCDGGLFACSVCNGFEGAMPSECPGAPMDSFTSDKVYTTDLDFLNGTWQRIPYSFAGSISWWLKDGNGTEEIRAEFDRVDALPSMERAKIKRGW